MKRLVLPSLTEFNFKGDSEYLEDIVGRIDAPALDRFTITFFNQLVFDTPLLRNFFSRTEVFQETHRAEVWRRILQQILDRFHAFSARRDGRSVHARDGDLISQGRVAALLSSTIL